jgi:hypothetical protein
MYNEIYSDYLKAIGDLGVTDKKYYNRFSLLENEYLAKLKAINKAFEERQKPACCGDGNTSCCVSDEEKCTARNELANAYLPKFADLTEEWQKQNRLVFSTYLDEILYWGYLFVHPSGDDTFRQQVFYPMVTQYLTMLGKIATTKIIEPCEYTPVEKQMVGHELKEYECPVDVDISIVVANLTIDCGKISFSGGEGALFKYQKDLKTKKSTLSVGIGLQLPPLSKELGQIEIGAGAGVSETIFITFDGNNKIEDFGLEVEAHASAGVEASHGKSVEISKEFSKEAKVGCRFGVNSGVNFDEGPFKGMVGPEQPIQLNKNVNVFKE